MDSDFGAGKEVSEVLDLSKIRRPNRESKAIMSISRLIELLLGLTMPDWGGRRIHS